MIKLDFSNEGVFIFDVEDWFTLRKNHRIVGQIAGNTSFIPAMPVKLIPEEALYLVENGIATIVETEFTSSPEKKAKYEEFEAQLLSEQKIIHRENRKKQLELMIEDIVKAKREKGDERTTEEIFNEELDKSSVVTEDVIIWPILLTPLTTENCKQRQVPKEEITKHSTLLKTSVFRDLMEKGYYVTQGHKFGADFLAYKGDPLLFHAIFIVRCVENKTKAIHSTEIVAFGRLGTAVRKRAVFAYFNEENKVCYMTINWLDD